MKLEVKEIALHYTVVESIRDHAREQADKGSYEAVGFVASNDDPGLGVATVPLHNHAPNPQHAFFVEPWEQFQAEKKLDDFGYNILGVYHSHVNSEALPSQSDHKMARPEEYVFIYSVVFDELKAYKENGGILEPVTLIIKEAD
jgi:proteasome lid subunit RPN8/RPN11